MRVPSSSKKTYMDGVDHSTAEGVGLFRRHNYNYIYIHNLYNYIYISRYFHLLIGLYALWRCLQGRERWALRRWERQPRTQPLHPAGRWEKIELFYYVLMYRMATACTELLGSTCWLLPQDFPNTFCCELLCPTGRKLPYTLCRIYLLHGSCFFIAFHSIADVDFFSPFPSLD